MRKQCLLLIIFILLFIVNVWGVLKGLEENILCILSISLIICTITQGIMSYVLKSKGGLCIFAMYSFLLCLQLYYYPFFYGATKDYNNNIKVGNDSTFTMIYDYYDDISLHDSQPCLILKEGEIGAYYFDLYLYNEGHFEISFYIWPIDNPDTWIYQKNLKIKNYGHNGTVIKDSFIVSTDESKNLIPSYFKVQITKFDNYSTQVIKKKYLLHQWRR